MKQTVMNLMAALLVCCGLVITATATDQKLMGKNKKKTVTFNEDVMVNDQLIKQGTYQVKLDAANSEIIISDNDGDVIAKAKANVKLGDRKAEYNSISAEQTPKGKVMTGLTFAGDRRIITLDSTANNAADGQGQQ